MSRYNPKKIRKNRSRKHHGNLSHPPRPIERRDSHQIKDRSYYDAIKYRPKPAVIPLSDSPERPFEKPSVAKEEAHRALRGIKRQIKELQRSQEYIRDVQEKLSIEKRFLDLSPAREDPYQAWFNLNSEERILSVRVVSWGDSSGQFDLILDPEEKEDLFSSTLSSTQSYRCSIDHFHPSISSWNQDQVVEVKASGREICHLSFEIEKFPRSSWIEFQFD